MMISRSTLSLSIAILAACVAGSPLLSAQQLPDSPQPTAEQQAAQPESLEEQLPQFLEQLERARTALEQGAHGMGENALRNAAALLDHLTTADDGLEDVEALMLEAETAVADGQYGAARAALLRIEERVGQALEAAGIPRRPTAPDDPTAHVTIAREDIIGADVVDGDGETVASVSDVFIPLDGSMPRALLDLGGFLGIGERTVAVPMDRLAPVEDDTLMLRDMTVQELEALPDYDPAEE